MTETQSPLKILLASLLSILLATAFFLFAQNAGANSGSLEKSPERSTDKFQPHRSPVQIQPLFLFKPQLRRILHLQQGIAYFQICDDPAKACERITRNISAAELKMEHQLFEQHLRSRFRLDLKAGTVLMSPRQVCTVTGIRIAAVPGLAGGAVVCLNPATQKISSKELPLNIQALDELSKDLQNEVNVIARGEDGEIYVANLELIVEHLKKKYPPEL